MNKREKILAMGLIAVLAGWGGLMLIKSLQSSASVRDRELQAARRDLDQSTLAIASGRHAERQLAKWQARSLPANRDVAHSLYRTWLLEKTKAAGLAVDDINPNERTSVSKSYQSIGYVIEARGTLGAVIKFLYEFYSATQLQQITKLQLTATPGGADLRVQLQVEAVILPGATNKDSLPQGKSERLKLASASEYEKSIVGRDLFKKYTPPRPPRVVQVARTTPRPPQFDDASQAYVTGIVQTGSRLQAWITIRTTGEVLRLHEGDELKVGALNGKIESISPRMVVVRTDEDESLRIQLGHSLRDEDKPGANDEAASTRPDPRNDS